MDSPTDPSRVQAELIYTSSIITIETVRDYPHWAFIFGDNLERRGRLGQAQIRYQSNAYGIPTKLRPSMALSSFFGDDDYLDNVREILFAASKIPRGWVVVVPVGIGQGLAQMPQRCPQTYAFLQRVLRLPPTITLRNVV